MSAARRSRTGGSSKTRKSVADGCPSVLRASGKCASRARKNDASNRTVRWVTQGYRCATARSSAAFASILIRTAFGRSSRFVTVPASTAATRSVGVMRSKSAAVMIRRSGMRFRLPGSETPERRSRLRRVRKPSHPLCVGRLDGRVLQKRPHDARQHRGIARSSTSVYSSSALGVGDANGLTTAAPLRLTSSTFRVTSVRSCSSAVAAIRPSITGTGSGTDRSAHR